MPHLLSLARRRSTAAAQALAKEHNARLVDLATLDRDLTEQA